MPLKKKNCGTLVKSNCHKDIISNLPDSLRETILIFLPLQDAVRTSVLSSKWRYTWTKIPHLDFDNKIWPGSSGGDQLERQNKCVRRILHVLLQHEGPITSLYLSIPELEIFPEIDNLMVLLSKSDVEDLTLLFWSGDHYKLPSTFFKCQRLKSLYLMSCLVHPPSDFIGFSQLLTIDMFSVAIGSEQLESLIACCPLLEYLKLENFSVYEALEIQAPKLKYFKFNGEVESVCFKNTPLLEEIVIVNDSHIQIGKESSFYGESNLIGLFGSLPALSVLHFDNLFIQFSAASVVLKRSSLTALHLNTLKLEGICLEKMGEMTGVLFIVRISPNLQGIKIRLLNPTCAADQKFLSPESLNVEEYLDLKLDQLRRVELEGFTGTRNQMALAKLLLIKSPGLMKMIIEPNAQFCDETKGFLILKELIRLPRPSTAAEIIYG
ncbi:unnamed protein product [Cuscuta epithymum]|uniref:F-box domain-containing protein n=1 Tax=Cuscuta epithymum TaxID=186058 RepID=A0AAV0DDL1_9ASTE|nr:unnamed protein product [Cuscuta epithymum]